MEYIIGEIYRSPSYDNFKVKVVSKIECVIIENGTNSGGKVGVGIAVTTIKSLNYIHCPNTYEQFINLLDAKYRTDI